MGEIQKRYESVKEKSLLSMQKERLSEKIQIKVGSATCEDAAGASGVAQEFQKHILSCGRSDVVLRRVGCNGRCSLEPIVTIVFPKQKPVMYQKVTKQLAHEIFISHILNGKILSEHLLNSIDHAHQKTKAQEMLEHEPMTKNVFDVYGDIAFYTAQTRMALRNAGLIDPLNLDEYISYGGFSSLAKILDKNDPVWAIEEMKKSKLRGRGGAGFSTALKWELARKSPEKMRYMICNADEGDPGAFMDRSMLESDPFSIVEGMMIAGFCIGAEKGFFYIRAEYPLAIERIQQAINICKKEKLLGSHIFGSNWNFDLEIRLGAGAFVCGEETALIHSIEGERGQPRIRPPFPTESGLWNKPTVINNVETLANLPVIFSLGGENFGKIGTEKSGGTKVFAVSGKVERTGLVEVPMGTTLRDVVFSICGGIPNNKKIKAVQTGGPAGGCIPEHLLDTPIDYENLSKLGSIMGSGGLIVLDEDTCMVNMAKFFMTFSQDESCGKCTPCREGTLRILEILERITEGKGCLADLDKLERLCLLLQKASLCGLGKGAPNPVLSTLKYFKDEYLAHVVDKRCPSKECKALIKYEIDPEKCIGCTMCARNCPAHCIAGERKQVHVINQDKCIRCGRCFEVCRFGAVKTL